MKELRQFHDRKAMVPKNDEFTCEQTKGTWRFNFHKEKGMAP